MIQKKAVLSVCYIIISVTLASTLIAEKKASLESQVEKLVDLLDQTRKKVGELTTDLSKIPKTLTQKPQEKIAPVKPPELEVDPTEVFEEIKERRDDPKAGLKKVRKEKPPEEKDIVTKVIERLTNVADKKEEAKKIAEELTEEEKKTLLDYKSKKLLEEYILRSLINLIKPKAQDTKKLLQEGKDRAFKTVDLLRKKEKISKQLLEQIDDLEKELEELTPSTPGWQTTLRKIQKKLDNISIWGTAEGKPVKPMTEMDKLKDLLRKQQKIIRQVGIKAEEEKEEDEEGESDDTWD